MIILFFFPKMWKYKHLILKVRISNIHRANIKRCNCRLSLFLYPTLNNLQMRNSSHMVYIVTLQYQYLCWIGYKSMQIELIIEHTLETERYLKLTQVQLWFFYPIKEKFYSYRINHGHHQTY